MLWFVPTLTYVTCAGLMSCRRMSRSISVIPGCVSEPEGCGLIEAAAGRAEKAARRFENVGRGGPPERRELGRDYAAFGRASGMEGLGHGAEIFAQPGRLAGGDRQRAPRRFRGVAEQVRDRRRGAE